MATRVTMLTQTTKSRCQLAAHRDQTSCRNASYTDDSDPTLLPETAIISIPLLPTAADNHQSATLSISIHQPTPKNISNTNTNTSATAPSPDQLLAFYHFM
jgi:hypothetical protein